MKVDKNTGPPFERRSDVVRKSLAQKPAHSGSETHDGMQRPRRDRREQPSKRWVICWNFSHFAFDSFFEFIRSVRVSVDLFGGKPLGIFTNTAELQDTPDILSTWNYLNRRELKLAATHPPRNYFEKMAIWTEQGKLWKFPIDNEQGTQFIQFLSETFNTSEFVWSNGL